MRRRNSATCEAMVWASACCSEETRAYKAIRSCNFVGFISNISLQGLRSVTLLLARRSNRRRTGWDGRLRNDGERQFVGALKRLLFQTGALRNANQRAMAWPRRGPARHGIPP